MKLNNRRYKILQFGKRLAVLWFLCFIGWCAKAQEATRTNVKRTTIMGLGDSITEGSDYFTSYLFPLWEKLFAGGYSFEFIGPRSSKCRIGSIRCAGYSGKNAEYLDSIIDRIYLQYPADVVLLHSGHNHFNDENPVAGIIAAQKSIIAKIQAINPTVKILVASVIPGGKLPKYAYISQLNTQIREMVNEIDSPNVVLVDQATGFNWNKNTVSDHVHPNDLGAKKIAGNWYAALKRVLPKPQQVYQPSIMTYKGVDSVDLKLHVFLPDGLKINERRPAIIFFFGGGWTLGTPLQFYRECTYYASKGIVAISADYRIASVHKTTPFESVDDAKDAIRWLREHASELHVNPDMIVASGASAGGHLAAAMGTLPDPDCRGRARSKPNLMILYYPVIDNSETGYGPEIVKKRYQEISPLHNVSPDTPPCLFILGTKDKLIPVQTGQQFQQKMQSVGVNCELELFEGAGHPIFYYQKDLTDDYYRIRTLTDHFLFEYGYLNHSEN